MSKLIKIDELSYEKDNLLILDTINLEFDYGQFISIVGPSTAGKSSLINVLLGKNKYTGNISYYFNDEVIDKQEFLRYVYVISKCTFKYDKVYDEIAFPLRKRGLTEIEISNKILEISRYLNIDDLLDCIPSSLSSGQKQVISLVLALVNNPKILIIDDALDMVDSITKDKILTLLRRINNNEKITIIYVTKNLDETLYSKRLVLLYEGKVLLDGKPKKMLENVNAFKDARMSLPFMVDLSKKLQYYELVDKINFNMDKLVNVLWK